MSTAKKVVKKVAPKPTATKPVVKKAPVKKAPVKKTKAVVKAVAIEASAVVLNKTQEKQVAMIVANEDRMKGKFGEWLAIAINSGERLNLLKLAIKKQNAPWKEWAENNLPMSYPQATRYMKVAGGKALIEGKIVSSLEDAVKLVTFGGDIAALEASGEMKNQKQQAATATATANAAPASPARLIEDIDAVTDLETLTMLRDYIQGKIDNFGTASVAPASDDDIDGESEEVEDTDDASDIDDLING
jgi:hypothetical protein